MRTRTPAALLLVLSVACGSSRATAESPTPRPARTAITEPAGSSPTGVLVTSTASPTAKPTATPFATATVEPLAIGDPCLVGRWILTNLTASDSTAFAGVTLSMTGQLGTVMTLGADGTEVFDLTNSTRLTGEGGGHTVSWVGRGVQRFAFRGQGGHWDESGPSQFATGTNVVVDGVSRPDFTSEAPPFSGTYACSETTLTMSVALPNYSQTATFKK